MALLVTVSNYKLIWQFVPVSPLLTGLKMPVYLFHFICAQNVFVYDCTNACAHACVLPVLCLCSACSRSFNHSPLLLQKPALSPFYYNYLAFSFTTPVIC
jgi:hypothetical protein